MEQSADLVVRSRRVVTPNAIGPAAIHIRSGVIAAIGPLGDAPPQGQIFDAGDAVVMPGIVDTHVHVNEPGRTDWEGFESATRAAAAGGVTTLGDMPLNSVPPTTTLEGFRAKVDAARGRCWVDIGFWGGVVPGNTAEIRPLLEEGVLGFKCFLLPSGVDEFPHVSEPDLRAALVELKGTGSPLLAHAELSGPIEEALPCGGCSARSYATWLSARPRQAEDQAIALLIRLASELDARIHVVHLSSSTALEMLREAKSGGLEITVETCPHYLFFAAEEIPEGATEFKCAPPVRERQNREKLWAALGEGLIDMVVSDHSPCPPAMKCGDSGDFLRAWGGISSLQLSLAATWTEARRRGHTILELADWMSSAPARLAGLERRKGALAVGYDADLVVWDPEATFRVDPQSLHHRHKLTPYAVRELNGVVKATFLRGRKIYDEGVFLAGPMGSIIRTSDPGPQTSDLRPRTSDWGKNPEPEV